MDQVGGFTNPIVPLSLLGKHASVSGMSNLIGFPDAIRSADYTTVGKLNPHFAI